VPTTWLLALAGGVLIGLASALLLLTHGRVAGISGLLGSLVPPAAPGAGWRAAFLGGMLVAGAVAAVIAPGQLGASPRATGLVVIAGLLVGFGTRMGSGCTSGHGVCGLARLSSRSLVAVATFMTTGVLTVWLVGGAA
jgi:uncharacterized membrane protein YedE/YeeE